jgi:hypothetical protein
MGLGMSVQPIPIPQLCGLPGFGLREFAHTPPTEMKSHFFEGLSRNRQVTDTMVQIWTLQYQSVSRLLGPQN